MFLKANLKTVQGTNCINKGGTHHKPGVTVILQMCFQFKMFKTLENII